MKSTLPKFYVALAGLIACIQWSQIAYRLALFRYDYNSERGFNHVSTGLFGLVYTIDAALFCVGLFVIYSFLKKPGFWRASTVALVLANLAGGITLWQMHRTGVLVEYQEFIKNWQNSGPVVREDDSLWITDKEAERMALDFVSKNGFTNVHLSGGWLDGRFPKYQFTITNTAKRIKVIVDRKTSLVGYDYSHWP